MILQRLVEYYDRLADDPAVSELLARPGYSLQKLSFCVVLNADGSLQQFQSLLDASGKVPRPQQRLVPGQAKPSGSGLHPGFLWDNAAYMLGFKVDDSNPERTYAAFEAFRDRHLALEDEIQNPGFSAVCTFLRQWTPDKNEPYVDVLRAITGSFGVFRLSGEQRFVHEEKDVIAFWARQDPGTDDNPSRGMCLVTGQDAPIARLHEPKIKGVRNAQSAGALLVSFDKGAYTSLGKEQGYNAPVSQDAAFSYTNALNYLLAREDRRVSLGDATVVFWAERPTVFEDFVSDLFAEGFSTGDETVKSPTEDLERADEIQLLLSQLREGYAASDALDPECQTRFYILGLSPNAARISVRFWIQSTVGELKAHLGQHLRDVELIDAREDDPALTIRRIVTVCGRAEGVSRGRVKRYDTDVVSPLLAGAIARAVLTGGPYPQVLLNTLLLRIKADGVINHARVAAIKGCIVPNSRLQGYQPVEITVALDKGRTDAAYVTGRLFALLEKIQTDSANSDLNTTIKDRYFSSASSTPSVVFPLLIRLSQHHLAKLDHPQKIFFEKQVGEVMSKLSSFAPHFGLQDQGLFAVGYFHQRQDLFTSRKTTGENAA